MKSYRHLCILVISLFFICMVGSNIYVCKRQKVQNKEYQVQIHRVLADIESSGLDNVDFSQYPAILSIDTENLYEDSEDFYVIQEIQGKLYRINYTVENDVSFLFWIVNGIFIAVGLLIFILFVYVYKKIIQPFSQLQNMPYELSKGNLTKPVLAQKDDYFGKFLWGMDMLREELESQKRAQLQLQKEKKLLVLSLTHDIKTPLSAILLYAQALKKNLYHDENKRTEAVESIHQNALEIEKYVKQIAQASHEDFLHLEVQEGEFYLSELVEKVKSYYSDKLKLLKIDFLISSYSNCLIQGDLDRAEEVIQNIIENAIKYGNGGRIAITPYREDDCCLIRIENENNKMDTTEAVHIFDSFWRGSNSENVPGSGLGLYICRQLMESMGGEIFVQVEDDVFSLTLVFSMA